MNYILASFHSRNETMAFARVLNANGIPATVVNTPSVIVRSCSVSVKLPNNALPIAQRLLSTRRFQTFLGFYIVYFINGQFKVDKI